MLWSGLRLLVEGGKWEWISACQLTKLMKNGTFGQFVVLLWLVGCGEKNGNGRYESYVSDGTNRYGVTYRPRHCHEFTE